MENLWKFYESFRKLKKSFDEIFYKKLRKIQSSIKSFLKKDQNFPQVPKKLKILTQTEKLHGALSTFPFGDKFLGMCSIVNPLM